MIAIIAVLSLSLEIPLVNANSGRSPEHSMKKFSNGKVFNNAFKMLKEGRETFRYDTFGDEVFWGDALQLHQAIKGENFGGVGQGVSPNTALAVGLKIDVQALPKSLKKDLRRGKVDLDDPATTLALLKLNAVIGITGLFDDYGNMNSIGIQCALCHTVVDNSFAPGIGHRLDGWGNRDLNVGAIIALAPNLQPFVDLLQIVIPGIDQDTVRAVLNSWGPGKFDAGLNLDGKALDQDGLAHPTLIPPAFGLSGVNLHTWTGWGSVSHWNAFVAVLEMGGQGTFYDPRLNNAEKFPIAAEMGFGNVRSDTDRVTKKLAALQFYQLALPTPTPPKGSFDKAAAKRGEMIFNGKADCARCHVPPLYTEPGWNLHTPEEMGIDAFQANRSPDGGYRTTPLKGLWTHMKGGFFHDGRFPTLLSVINHYDELFGLELTGEEKGSLIEFLKSL